MKHVAINVWDDGRRLPAAKKAFTLIELPFDRLRVVRQSERLAFTLIELLVVIGIIGLLIAMLMPSLAAAKRTANTVKCTSNIRQVMTAATAFSSSHRDQLPENRIARTPTEHITWRAFLVDENYLTEDEIWLCPLAPGSASEEGTIDRGSRCVDDVESNYAYNGHLTWKRQAEQIEAERDLVTIRRPSHTIALTETRAQFPDLRVTDGILAMDQGDGGWYGFWHDGGGAHAFIDGHAEVIKLLETGDPDCRWHNGADNAQDEADPQTPLERRRHGHPGWRFVVSPVYR